MNVLETYILQKAFHAVAVRPFQAALPALRLRVKNSELANVCVNIKNLARVGFVGVTSAFRQCYVNVTSATMSERSEAHKSCDILYCFYSCFKSYLCYVFIFSLLISFLLSPSFLR